MEMGVGLKGFKLGKEETDPLVHKTMRKVVEDKVQVQVPVPTEVQMQCKQGKSTPAGRIGE